MLAPVGPGLGPELGLPAARFCTEIFIFARFYKGFSYFRRKYGKSGPSARFVTFLLKYVPHSDAMRQNTVNVLICTAAHRDEWHNERNPLQIHRSGLGDSVTLHCAPPSYGKQVVGAGGLLRSSDLRAALEDGEDAGHLPRKQGLGMLRLESSALPGSGLQIE